MASDNSHKLDEGFSEVPLDEGFAEQPLPSGGSAREMAEMAAASPGSSQSLDAALAGAAQGSTFGFSDELGAGADVAGDVLTGKGIEGLGSKWREYQKKRESANKALSESNPSAYLLGEIGGGLATTPLMPELGGAKLVGAAGKLSPKVAAFLAGKAGGLGTKLAGKAVTGAIEGAPVGALYGAGSSEADLSKPSELAIDTLSGAKMGSLGGAAISAAAAGGQAALEGAPKVLNKYDFTRKLKESYGLGGEGVSFDTSAGKAQVAKMHQDIPNQLTDEILAADKALGQAVGDALTGAEKAGVRINIDPQLKASSQELFKTFAENPVLLQTVDPKSKALILKISQEGLGDLTPLEARALKDTFYGLSDNLQGLSSDVANIARQKGLSLGSALEASLKEQIPEYQKAAFKFAKFRSSIPEVALQPNLPADKRTKMLGNLKNKEAELYKGVKDVFGQAHMPGASTVEGPRSGLSEMTGNLSKLEPETVAALGGTPEQVGGKWQKLADRMAVLKQSQGVEPHEGLKKTVIGQVVGSGEGFAYNMANRAGKVAKSLSESAPVKVSHKLFAADDGHLMNLAQKMKASKATAFYGEALEKALMNKSQAAKNAVLFKLLQNPEHREMLKEEGFDEGFNEQQ